MGNSEVLAKWIGELALNLVKSGKDIDVFAPSSRGFPSHSFHGIWVKRFRYAPKSVEILTQEEGAVFKLKRNPWLVLLVPTFFLLGFISLIRLLKKNNYDIIHVHWPFPMGLFGVLAKKISNGKLVITFYGAEFTLLRKVPLGDVVLRYIISKADYVTAISTYTKSLVLKLKKVNVTIIPFTTGFSIDSNSVSRLHKKRKSILFVGRLIERKGIEYLIRAIPLVKESVDVNLTIVGSGLLKEELDDSIDSLKLSSSVKLAGRISDKKLKQLYAACDIFVLPSIVDRWGDTEGLGVVLLEAMSFKKPVVATNVGGIVDIVKHRKTGLLVKEKDPVALSVTIVEILTDEKLWNRLSKSGYQYAKKYFSWDAIIKKTSGIYEKI